MSIKKWLGRDSARKRRRDGLWRPRVESLESRILFDADFGVFTFGSGANTFSLEFVPIGNPGNAADTTGNPDPAGSVPYSYSMGKFEVSVDAVNKVNALSGLNLAVWPWAPNQPATSIDWYDSARFVNWLNTSSGYQPAYKFNGTSFQLWNASDGGQFNPANPFRSRHAVYVLPTLDEWYKAAYYDPSSGTYFDYPTGSNSPPIAVASGTDPNTAVYNAGLTDVTQTGGLSPYGTRGQGGHVLEWNETEPDLVNDSVGGFREVRGGASGLPVSQMLSTSRNVFNFLPSSRGSGVGYRVAKLSSANVNFPPVLGSIGNQTIASSTQDAHLQLSATDPNAGNVLTFQASTQSIEYHLDQTLGLGTYGGDEYLNWGGLGEKWFTATGGTSYYIKPDGSFYRWLGGAATNATLIETLSPADHANTALLYNAQANNSPSAVSVSGNQLTINPNDSFTGKLAVTVLVGDGEGGTDKETILVTVLTAGQDTTPPTVTSLVPTPGSTLTSAAVNIDVTFSETVNGVDATDLVLAGNGAANALKGTPVHTSGNTWRFPVSSLVTGTVNVTLAPDANDIEDTVGNDLATLSWTYTASIAVDTTPPQVTNHIPGSGGIVQASSINVDVTFSEAVAGVDSTDLVLSGPGAASSVKGTAVYISGNTWRFPVSNLVNGAVNVTLAPDANDIEDAAGNDLASTQWSFSVNIPQNPQPPVLDPIGDRTMATSTSDLVLILTASDPNNDPLTFSASAQSIEYHLDQTLGLNSSGGNEFLNWGGMGEKWFASTSGTWYYIKPDGTFYRWLGGAATNATLLETLSPADHVNTALLYSAQPNNAPSGVSVSGNQLTINPNDSFHGKFAVTATVSDGQGGIDNEAFVVSVLSAGPDTTPPTLISRTPSPGAAVNSASVNVDMVFSEPVNGVDVTDLVLTGNGATNAVKSPPVNIGNNTWRFAVNGLQNGAVDLVLAADANDIEDLSGNDLAPASWSFNVNIQAVPQPPVLAPIGDRTMPTTQDLMTLALVATDGNNDPLTFSVSAQSNEYVLDQLLGLGFSGGNEFLNWGGLGEKWFTGASGTWYYIKPNGMFYRWLGGAATNATLIETLNPAVFANTSLLYNAQVNNAPALVTVNGSTLTINPNNGFVGKFYVTIVVSDGQGGSDSETIAITLT